MRVARLIQGSACAAALALLVPAATGLAQGPNDDRVVAGGCIFVQGWKGRIAVSDTSSIRQGRKIEDSKFSSIPGGMRVESGPAAIYWNPANVATAPFTLKATFTEAKFQEFNDHPHSYGLFIGGNKLDTDQMSVAYCVVYGDGKALVRGINPTAPRMAFTLMRDTTENAAVHKAADKLQPVTNEITWHVTADRADCSVNGKPVAGYTKAEMVGAGKLESFDGIVGIRTTHNVDFTVTNWSLTKG